MQSTTAAPDAQSKVSIQSAITSHLTFAFIFSALVNSLFLASPLYMMQLYGRVLDSRSLETLASLSVALVLALVAMAGADAARGRILSRAALRVERRLTGREVDKSLPYERRLADIGAIRSFLSGNGATTLLDAPFTFLFLFVLFVLHPMLGITATLGAAVILISVVVSRKVNRERDRQISAGQTGLEQLSRTVDRDHSDLCALGAGRGLTRRLSEGMLDVAALRQENAESMAGFGAFNRLIRMVSHSAALATGAILTLQGELAPAAMLAAAILAGRALGPMETLPAALRQASAARSAMNRLTKKAERHGTGLKNKDHARPATIAVSRAMVMLKGPQRAVLRSVNITVAAGEVISVAGATGSGKSVLARVLAGIEPLSSGQIHIAGEDPGKMDSDSRAAYIGWMPQDVTLYPGSVAENIARFCDATFDECLAAADKANARTMIEKLPDGFATEVGEDGRNLSPGLRQRIALARAVVGKPRLVILDQPTSHMDAEGEVATLNVIRTLKEAGATVIVISHKPVLAAQADRILVMRDGSVDLFEARKVVIDAMRSNTLGAVPTPKVSPKHPALQEVAQ